MVPWRCRLWLESAVHPVAEELDVSTRPRALTATGWGHLSGGELLVHALGVVGVGHVGEVVQRYRRPPHMFDVHGGEQGADVPGETHSIAHVLNLAVATVFESKCPFAALRQRLGADATDNGCRRQHP